jgi:nucleotide-binding universal stress UspA family protein
MNVQLPIVVGYEGSHASQRAVDWAADEAALRDVSLTVVVVATSAWPVTGNPRHGVEHLLSEEVDDLVEAGVGRAATRAPSIHVTGLRLFDSPTSALMRMAGEASLLVVGSRGRGGVPGLSLGSVSGRLAQLASCPVVVVRGELRRKVAKGEELILVGVDESDYDTPPMSFALAEARLRGCELEILHSVPRLDPAVGFDLESARAEGKVFLDELAAWASKYPEIEARPVLDLKHPPAEALIAAAAEASLVVVGSHGPSAFTGIRLGSVSNAMVHAAPCPVAVVRPEPRH